jgi:hypothetical protein
MILEDVGIVRTGDLEDSDQTALNAGQGMVDQHVFAGDFDFELDHRRATGRHGLIAGASAPADIPTLADLRGGAAVTTAEVADLEPARTLAREVGLG